MATRIDVNDIIDKIITERTNQEKLRVDQRAAQAREQRTLAQAPQLIKERFEEQKLKDAKLREQRRRMVEQGAAKSQQQLEATLPTPVPVQKGVQGSSSGLGAQATNDIAQLVTGPQPAATQGGPSQQGTTQLPGGASVNTTIDKATGKQIQTTTGPPRRVSQTGNIKVDAVLALGDIVTEALGRAIQGIGGAAGSATAKDVGEFIRKFPGPTKQVFDTSVTSESQAAFEQRIEPEASSLAETMRTRDVNAFNEAFGSLRDRVGPVAAGAIVKRAASINRDFEMRANAASQQSALIAERSAMAESRRRSRPDVQASEERARILLQVNKYGVESVTKNQRDFLNEYAKTDPTTRIIMGALFPAEGTSGKGTPTQDDINRIWKALPDGASPEDLRTKLIQEGYSVP